MSIVPYCLCQKIEHSTNTFLSYIKQTEHCVLEPGYTSKFGFYGIDPDYKPMLYKTKLLCFKQNKEAPYGTIHIESVFDPFKKTGLCELLVGYETQVGETIPLYFYKRGNNVFISLDNTPPEPTGWDKNAIHSIYIMKSKDVKFVCNDNVCAPSSKEGVELDECDLRCEKLNIFKEESENIKKKNNTSFLDTYTPWLLLILFIIVYLYIIIVI